MRQGALILGAIVPLVAAHGFIQNATIGGKEYDVCSQDVPNTEYYNMI